jgi:hypothetical protein
MNVQSNYRQMIQTIFQPKIILSWKYMCEESMHAEVCPDRIFITMSWSDFHKISDIYKQSRIFPSYKFWKSWYDRIWTERMIEYRRDICEDKYRIFSNEKQFYCELDRVDRQISSTSYGKQKLKYILQKDIDSILYKMKCIENIRKNWAALKIQKAYRRQECMYCEELFHSGIGPYCSISCIQRAFN